jgi:hypothetical protein
MMKRVIRKLWMKSIKFTVKKIQTRDNPKHFWKILGGHKRKQQPNIEINTLYEFFKDLNTKGLLLKRFS